MEGSRKSLNRELKGYSAFSGVGKMSLLKSLNRELKVFLSSCVESSNFVAGRVSTEN